ncbi:AraC-type DNA-binding protein [Nannocystis exedens]|uniref:AraC-type DNA-binding protein n=1 Tax=Nannocystis exedens TaxID=54 RepID=A0A1I2BDS9_9BACT|nr:helix-turn-helix domain-containing protein [Nannocystis exedens]PCC68031.1 Helix-turn-helix domain protein [Nannocystis exedens]SFE54305.1 AraC-type DNA-binding protein [Nannocystis exedens]
MDPRRRARVTRSEAGGSRWEVATRELPAGLRAHVRGLLGYSEATPLPNLRRQFPLPQVVVIIELGPPIRVHDPDGAPSRYAGGFVAGLHDCWTDTGHDGSQRGIQLNLTPIGARLLFGVALSELAGRVVHLDDLLPRAHRNLAERLAALPDWDGRFDMVESFIASRLAEARVEVDTVAWACRRIEASAGAVDIGGLADELGYSGKHLIALFRDRVGVPPKLLARLVRFDHLVRRLKSGPPATWAELAAELGFADQAHLTREIRSFTGITPTGARARLSDPTFA